MDSLWLKGKQLRKRRDDVEHALVELAGESTKAAVRLSWKGAAILGAFLFLVVGVAVPYALEWWSESRTLASQSTAAGRMFGPALHQVLIIRAVFPLRIIGSIAGMICLVISMWKLLKEIRRT